MNSKAVLCFLSTRKCYTCILLINSCCVHTQVLTIHCTSPVCKALSRGGRTIQLDFQIIMPATEVYPDLITADIKRLPWALLNTFSPTILRGKAFCFPHFTDETEKLGNLPRFSQLTSGRVQNYTQAIYFQSPGLCCLVKISQKPIEHTIISLFYK